MSGNDDFTRAELVARSGNLANAEPAARGASSAVPAELPVFSEWHQREFDKSPWPMRIFEHGTFRYLAVNDAAVEFYGYPRHEFLALTAKDTRHPEEHAGFLFSMEASTGFLRHRGPRRHVKKSGEVVVVELVTQDVIFDGRLARMAMTIDVTDRVRMQELLLKREQEFETLAENLPDIVVRFDRDIRHVYVNAAVARLTGLPREAFIGKTHFEIPLPREKAELFDRCMREVFETGRPNTIEFSFDTPAGERFFEARHIPEFGSNGEVLSALCIGHDITKRKHVEKSLRDSKEWLELAVESSGLALWDSNLVTGEVKRQPRWEELLGCLPGETPGSVDIWRSRIHPEDWPKVKAARDEHLRGSTLNYVSEHRLRIKSGAWIWVLDRGRVVERDAAGKPLRMIGGCEDITAQKHAEENRIVQLVQQRDALVREVHHRIRNSLQGVAGLLRQKIQKYPAIVPGIEEAISQLQSVALVYGLQETRPDGLIVLAEIIDEVCASAEGLTGGHVERTFERKSTRPACVAGSEAVSVAVALNELVFNALKHQAGAGMKRARVTLLESNDAAEIRIANRGKLPKGFDYPAGRAVGHGLGLVRTLLASPGGNVAFNGGRNEVEVVLKLRPPLLAGRQKAIAG